MTDIQTNKRNNIYGYGELRRNFTIDLELEHVTYNFHYKNGLDVSEEFRINDNSINFTHMLFGNEIREARMRAWLDAIDSGDFAEIFWDHVTVDWEGIGADLDQLQDDWVREDWHNRCI